MMNVKFIAPLEIANVLLHPGARLIAFSKLDGVDDFALRRLNSRARLGHAINQLRQRWNQQQVERRLRQRQNLIGTGGRHCGKKIHHRRNRAGGIGDLAFEARAGARQFQQLRGGSP